MRILFIAESVTLAHFARPVVLAQALDTTKYDIYFASSGKFNSLFPELPGQHEYLYSITPDEFIKALSKGRRLYSRDTLISYVEKDLELIDRIQPDIIVGDFRLSLSVSARLKHVPYANVSSIYWSPYADVRFPVPELPFSNALPLGVLQGLFDLVRPFVFRLHASPINQVRRHFGLREPYQDLRQVYTDGDYTLYSDIPGLIPTRQLPATHHFLGPVLWSPDVSLPPWWEDIDRAVTTLYATLGSSGRACLMERVLKGLLRLEQVQVMVSTAGQRLDVPKQENLFLADYLPGTEAAKRADMVICNGGSLTSYQALASGIPVLGVAGNLDQQMNMSAIAKRGAGIHLRSDRLTSECVYTAAKTLLDNQEVFKATKQLQEEVLSFSVADRFARIIETL